MAVFADIEHIFLYNNVESNTHDHVYMPSEDGSNICSTSRACQLLVPHRKLILLGHCITYNNKHDNALHLRLYHYHAERNGLKTSFQQQRRVSEYSK